VQEFESGTADCECLFIWSSEMMMKLALVAEARDLVREQGSADKAMQAVPADRADLAAAIQHLWAVPRRGVIRARPALGAGK
jgi:hypothetical protein